MRSERIESPTASVALEGPVAIISHDPSCVPTATGPALVCTGTLIAKNLVLTAAHCLESAPPSAFDVVSGGRTVRVRAGRAHPGFESATHQHDIAVLVLEQDAPAQPMPLRREPMDLAAGSGGLRVVGFGNDAIAEQQGTVTLDAIEPEQLKLLPGPSMTCRGDSGGPLLRPNGTGFELVGVTTHGDPACKVDGYAARIDVHLAFIDEALAEAARPRTPRKTFDPSTNLCGFSCTTDADCPEGLSCAEEKQCSFGGLPPSHFERPCTGTCSGEIACVRVSADACRCADPCAAVEPTDAGAEPVVAGSGGCATSTGSPTSWLPLALLALVRRRR